MMSPDLFWVLNGVERCIKYEYGNLRTVQNGFGSKKNLKLLFL